MVNWKGNSTRDSGAGHEPFRKMVTGKKFCDLGELSINGTHFQYQIYQILKSTTGDMKR
jgi:ABC-type uncharacterized transport system ATPase subunit